MKKLKNNANNLKVKPQIPKIIQKSMKIQRSIYVVPCSAGDSLLSTSVAAAAGCEHGYSGYRACKNLGPEGTHSSTGLHRAPQGSTGLLRAPQSSTGLHIGPGTTGNLYFQSFLNYL